MGQLMPVPFQGDQLFVVDHDGQPYTPARPIAAALGLAWQGQRQKFEANQDRWGVMMIMTPSQGGPQETLCIPVRKVPAWLANINQKKVRAEIRPKLAVYQAECDDALYRYWAEGRVERPSAQPVPAPQLPGYVQVHGDYWRRLRRRERLAVAALLEARPDWDTAARYHLMGLNRAEIARLLGTTVTRVNQALDLLIEMELLPTKPVEPYLARVWRKRVTRAIRR